MFLPYLRAAFNAIKPEVAQPRNLTDFFQEELFIEIVKEESEESRVSKIGGAATNCGVRAWPWRMNTNSVEPTAIVY